jgi:hypothetical protein
MRISNRWLFFLGLVVVAVLSFVGSRYWHLAFWQLELMSLATAGIYGLIIYRRRPRNKLPTTLRSGY